MNARNATLADLATMLKAEQVRKLDLITPASQLQAEGGLLRIHGSEPVITPDGVLAADGEYRPTDVCISGLAEKLKIPSGYLQRTATERPDIFDANVNAWLHGSDYAPGDGRSFMVRTFRGDDSGAGIARAVLSEKYATIDHLDALTATLQGVRDAGVEVDIDTCDLTDRRMYVRVRATQVKALAPALLHGYTSPFTGDRGADNPTVFAGFIISNSEVGAGAFTITPRLIVEVCNNGMTISKDALRAVHLGGRQDEGVINWSTDTNEKALGLITAKTRDAVATFLDTDYMERVIARLTDAAGVRVEPAKAAEVVQTVSKRLAFSQDVADGVLGHFIAGGQLTAGGVMQAVTSFAQTIEDADTAAEVEASGVNALALAAAAAR